jgi:hypothetical protein
LPSGLQDDPTFFFLPVKSSFAVEPKGQEITPGIILKASSFRYISEYLFRNDKLP